jgi:glucose-1-phosphate cytidylyltransferase
MQVVILAGGRGTRLTEETVIRPKPMVEIGGKPMLWHIMQIYAAHGFKDFVVACGYRGDVIKEYWNNARLHNSDVVVDLARGDVHLINASPIDWRVAVIDTGVETQTGGRLKRLRDWVGKETFMATYGDGVSDLDVKALVDFHRRHGKLATVTAVHPPARFGSLNLQGDAVGAFSEKAQASEGWINGGFFVFEPQVLEYIGGDETLLEREPLERLAQDGQLMAYRHAGFWQAMDTLREKQHLESLWASGKAPWKQTP